MATEKQHLRPFPGRGRYYNITRYLERGPPVNTSEGILRGHRAWLRIGLFTSRLRMFRVRGGFVCPCRWVAFGVGFFGRSARRWFRLSQFWFAFAVGFFLRVLCLFALGVGPLRRVRRFRFSALLVVCGHSRFASVLVVLRVRWFRIAFSLFGAECLSTHAKIGRFAL